jgi:hypothetical protein
MTTALEHLTQMASGDAVLGDDVKLTVRIYETKAQKLAAAAAEGQNRTEARDEWRGEVGFDAHIKVYAPANVKMTGKSLTFTIGPDETDMGDQSERPRLSQDKRRPKVVIYTVRLPEAGVSAWYFHPAQAARPKTVTVKFVGKGTL